MTDEAKAAFASATEAVKNTLTLSTAVLTVSITFLKDINKNPSNIAVYVIEGSWICLFVAILAGVATLMSLTGTLAKVSDPQASAIYSKNVKGPMSIAVVAFLIGVALTAVYGMMSV